jgi:hypothetical protein
MSSQYQDDQEWLDHYEKQVKKQNQEIKEIKKHLKQYQNNEICMNCHEHVDICSQIGGFNHKGCL